MLLSFILQLQCSHAVSVFETANAGHAQNSSATATLPVIADDKWLALSSETLLFERALLPAPAKMVTLHGWNMVGTESTCDRYTLLNETQCWQKCEQSAKCELVTFGVNKKLGYCCLHDVNKATLLGKPVQSRHWKIIYEEQPVLHRVEGQVFWGDKIRRFDVDQEEVCSLACAYDLNCNVAAFKKTKNVCFLMKNMDVPRNVWDPEYITFYTESQLKL
ncbi:hypothetical protein BV898_09108 [Hypsibius exemplaris]|uniref:Apple domain-containing protein n=1 Tax=Hypsibius exemplaris TaxID=2072580 RepID=A0A1W0WNF7_HYPEX|nr:hypothetical protein BV898_09108 [Hypsibius exemplaris]